MIIRKHLAAMLVALLTLGLGTGAAAEWQAEEGDRLQERAEEAIDKVRKKVESAISMSSARSLSPRMTSEDSELSVLNRKCGLI